MNYISALSTRVMDIIRAMEEQGTDEESASYLQSLRSGADPSLPKRQQLTRRSLDFEIARYLTLGKL